LDELPKASFIDKEVIFEPIKVDIVVPKQDKTIVRINILKTYERVLESGYLSAEMLRRVADWHFFEGDLDVAEKWYTELFCLNSDLDIEFYYRYSVSLKSVGQREKANEMMAIFENKKG